MFQSQAYCYSTIEGPLYLVVPRTVMQRSRLQCGRVSAWLVRLERLNPQVLFMNSFERRPPQGPARRVLAQHSSSSILHVQAPTNWGPFNPVGPLKLLSPIFARIGQKVWNKRLARLQAALESSARDAAVYKGWSQRIGLCREQPDEQKLL